MEESAAAQLQQEIDAITISCDMQHPAGPGKAAEPCTRPAAYIATVHNCTKKRDYPDNGTPTPICDYYVTEIKGFEYPFRCAGCAQDITSLISLIWDIRRI